MTGHRTKRPFTGDSADPLQRQIPDFFSISSSGSQTTPRKAAAPASIPNLPAAVQSNLLSVGMRIRKSVSEGYKTGAAKNPVGVGLVADMYMCDNNNDNTTTITTPTSTYETEDGAPPPGSQPRELLPFCGINKIGGLDNSHPAEPHLNNGGVQPTINTIPNFLNQHHHIPTIFTIPNHFPPSSQTTTISSSCFSSSSFPLSFSFSSSPPSPPPSSQPSKKRPHPFSTDPSPNPSNIHPRSDGGPHPQSFEQHSHGHGHGLGFSQIQIQQQEDQQTYHLPYNLKTNLIDGEISPRSIPPSQDSRDGGKLNPRVDRPIAVPRRRPTNVVDEKNKGGMEQVHVVEVVNDVNNIDVDLDDDDDDYGHDEEDDSMLSLLGAMRNTPQPADFSDAEFLEYCPPTTARTTGGGGIGMMDVD